MAKPLIDRQCPEIDREICQALLSRKIILVTGAAGSIGSELCRQIVCYHPSRLLMLDNNESSLYDLAVIDVPVALPIVGDVTNHVKMEAIFEKHHPQIVFHAAAYKHVPLMEEHPDEAVRVNILGTKIVVELAVHYGVECFVFLSTDKAVNPSSVMGATKQLGEFLVANCGMLATAVRFGNILGSRGSVVPLFERQIEMGRPVTVTHPDMTRYFMTVEEAVSLIIQAAALTEGNDIFMLDMGQRINIDDLARRLIRLHGLEPGIDIPITYIGVRPGEKSHEELVGGREECFRTAHPNILRIENHLNMDKELIFYGIDELISLAEGCQNSEIKEKLWEVDRMLSPGGRR